MKLNPRLKFLTDPIVIISICIMLMIGAIANVEAIIKYLGL
jgi:hypothetical protein